MTSVLEDIGIREMSTPTKILEATHTNEITFQMPTRIPWIPGYAGIFSSSKGEMMCFIGLSIKKEPSHTWKVSELWRQHRPWL